MIRVYDRASPTPSMRHCPYFRTAVHVADLARAAGPVRVDRRGDVDEELVEARLLDRAPAAHEVRHEGPPRVAHFRVVADVLAVLDDDVRALALHLGERVALFYPVGPRGVVARDDEVLLADAHGLAGERRVSSSFALCIEAVAVQREDEALRRRLAGGHSLSHGTHAADLRCLRSSALSSATAHSAAKKIAGCRAIRRVHNSSHLSALQQHAWRTKG